MHLVKNDKRKNEKTNNIETGEVSERFSHLYSKICFL